MRRRICVINAEHTEVKLLFIHSLYSRTIKTSLNCIEDEGAKGVDGLGIEAYYEVQP